jgi:hypothetical protein
MADDRTVELHRRQMPDAVREAVQHDKEAAAGQLVIFHAVREVERTDGSSAGPVPRVTA